MSGNYWELTQQILQSGSDPLVTKPKLQEKLLQKPPFKFLHDVITAVQSSTGFAPGLFTEEEMAKDTLEKDGKITYLTKIFQVVSMVLQQPVPADPRKVIAGQDPESTNVFLQLLGQAARTGTGVEAVQMVLHGVQPGPAAPPPAATRAPSQQRSRDPPPAPPPQQAPPPTLPPEQPPAPPPAPPQVPRQAAPQPAPQLTKQRSKGREPGHQYGDDNTAAKPKMDRSSSRADGDRSRKNSIHEDSKPSRSKLSRQDSGGSNKAAADAREQSSPIRRTSSNSIPKPVSSSKADSRSVYEPPQASPDQLTSKPTRLQSAGRAPPKRVESKSKAAPPTAAPAPTSLRQQTLGPSIAPSKPVAVLEEGEVDDNQDDVEVVVETMPARSAISANITGENQGILVKNIMEAEKALKRQAGAEMGAEEGAESGGTGIVLKRLGRSSAPSTTKTNDISAIREMVQQLCTNTQPLGKCMEYLQEDLDSMAKEYRFWVTERRVFQEKLAEEQKLQQDVPSSQAQVADLDSQISQTRDRILSLKAHVLRNEETIHKLISMVVSSTG